MKTLNDQLAHKKLTWTTKVHQGEFLNYLSDYQGSAEREGFEPISKSFGNQYCEEVWVY